MLDKLIDKQVRILVAEFVMVGILKKNGNDYYLKTSGPSYPFSSGSISRVRNRVILLK